MRKPNLFIIGNPKSGTTAMYNFLESHPDIYMSPVKEPYYFAKDFISEGDSYRQKVHKSWIGQKINEWSVTWGYRNESDYLNLFKDAQNEQIIGEATPAYLYSKVAAKEIQKFNPNAKIIAILREPVSFLYSLHAQTYVAGVEDQPNFKKALALEEKRKRGEKIPRHTRCPRCSLYYEWIKYADHLSRFYKYFNTSQIKIIIFEDFKARNEQIYIETLKFLGVNSEIIPEFKHINPTEFPRKNKINMWIKNSYIKKIIQTVTPPRLYYSKIIPTGKRILRKRKKRPTLKPEFRKELMRRFKPEVEKTSEFLNINLVRKWGYDEIE